MDTISSIFKAIAAVFGFATQRDAEKNTAPVQAAAAAQRDQDEQAAEAKATAQQDLTKSREELAE